MGCGGGSIGKYMPRKHEDLNLIPNTYIRLQDKVMLVIPALVKWEHKDPRGFLSRQPSLIDKFWANGRCCLRRDSQYSGG